MFNLNIMQLKCIKLAIGCLHLLSVIHLNTKVVILAICDTVLTFPDLMLKLQFKGPKEYLIYVQYCGIYFCYF